MRKTIDPPGEFDYHVEKIDVSSAVYGQKTIDGRIAISGSFIGPSAAMMGSPATVVLPCGIRVPAIGSRWTALVETKWIAVGPPIQANGIALLPGDFKELMRLIRITELQNTIRLAKEELKALEREEA